MHGTSMLLLGMLVCQYVKQSCCPLQIYNTETEYLQAEYSQCGTVLKVHIRSRAAHCIHATPFFWALQLDSAYSLCREHILQRHHAPTGCIIVVAFHDAEGYLACARRASRAS